MAYKMAKGSRAALYGGALWQSRCACKRNGIVINLHVIGNLLCGSDDERHWPPVRADRVLDFCLHAKCETMAGSMRAESPLNIGESPDINTFISGLNYVLVAHEYSQMGMRLGVGTHRMNDGSGGQIFPYSITRNMHFHVKSMDYNIDLYACKGGIFMWRNVWILMIDSICSSTTRNHLNVAYCAQVGRTEVLCVFSATHPLFSFAQNDRIYVFDLRPFLAKWKFCQKSFPFQMFYARQS